VKHAVYTDKDSIIIWWDDGTKYKWWRLKRKLVLCSVI